MKNRPLLGPVAVALCLAAGVHAGSFTSDFSNPNQTGFTLNGGFRADGVTPYPAIENGYLVLTYAENGLLGSIILGDLDPGAAVGGFKASLKTRIGGGTSTPADGLCFFFGALNSASNFGEEGPADTRGLAIALDTYDNTDGDPTTPGGEAPAIDVIVSGVTVFHKPVDVFFPLSDTFVPLNIELTANGRLSVDFKGTVICANLVLPGYAPAAGDLFGIGARTGGLNENNWVDDLSITTTAAGAGVAPGIEVQPASQTIAEYGSVTFSVLPTGTPPFTFNWTSDKTTLTDETNATLTLNNVSANLNGAKFTVTVTNPQGSIPSAEAILTVNADTVAPTALRAVGNEAFNAATITFSEPVVIPGATFTIAGLTVSGVTQPSPTTVVLATSAQTPGTVYTITINGVKDLAAAPNTIAADSKVDFTAFTWSIGFLKFEAWSGLSTTDNSLDNTLLADPRFPGSPDVVAFTSPFTSRTVYPDDTHEGYGGKMSGWLTPSESGSYRFFLYSDDSSRLFLSSDALPANAVRIAEETGCCNPFTEPPSERTSEPIDLVAGNHYYIEAIWKEGTGGDYCLVAWRKEDDSTPAAQLPVIPGEYLATYANPAVANVAISQQPANAATTENKTMTFAVAATGSPNPMFIQWQRANPATPTVFANIHGASGTSYTTPILKKAADNGAKYRAVVGVPGKAVNSAEATLTVDIDTTPPAVTRVAAGSDLRSLYIVFSEAMNVAKAGDFNNYSVPGLTVTGARVLDSQRVMVVTSRQAEDTSYTVTVGSQVTDTAIPANPIDPAANSGSFTSMVIVPAAMAWEIWTDAGGSTAVSALTSDPRYPIDPPLTKLTPGYEGPDFGDNLGARVRGFITPKTTGDYVFLMSTDDNGELYLSTDDSAANAVLIAREPVWGDLREWTGNGGGGGRCDAGPCLNISAPIHLVANQRYYTELLWKEGGGGDHGSVAWRLASAPDPANGDPPIWGDVLSTAVPKALPAAVGLPVAVASPLGSGDAAKPGFNVRIYQANQDGATASVNQVSRAEQEFLGLLGPNVADLSAAIGGIFPVDTVINWNQDLGDIGSIGGDTAIPGIPGLGANQNTLTDNIAAEIITYAEFPKAGAYMMSVASDDGFKLTATDTPPTDVRALRVHAPSTVAGQYYAASSATTYGGVFKVFTAPISGKLVLADPQQACSDLVNAAAVRGNIAFLYRGVCTFSSKCQRALNAGAIAVVIVNSRDPGSADGPWPIIMGGTYVDIPAVMMTKPDGNKILAALQAGETINVDISPDQTPALGIADYGRGVADTFFPVYVSQPGLYPMRLVWFEGGGGANVEWYSFDGAGNRALINDRSNPTAIKTYRARTFTPVTPTIGIRVDGANAVLTFTGVLQAANKVDGAFGDVVATSPHSVPLTGAPMKFWRSRRP